MDEKKRLLGRFFYCNSNCVLLDSLHQPICGQHTGKSNMATKMTAAQMDAEKKKLMEALADLEVKITTQRAEDAGKTHEEINALITANGAYFDDKQRGILLAGLLPKEPHKIAKLAISLIKSGTFSEDDKAKVLDALNGTTTAAKKSSGKSRTPAVKQTFILQDGSKHEFEYGGKGPLPDEKAKAFSESEKGKAMKKEGKKLWLPKTPAPAPTPTATPAATPAVTPAANK